MNFQTENPTNKELFKLALETRNLEIQLFWQRSNYFLILCTGITTAILLNIKSNVEIALGLSVFGFIVAILWFNVNLGSKFWQTRWEKKTAEFERFMTLGTGINFYSVTREVVEADVREFTNTRPYNFFRRCINNLVFKRPSVSMQMVYLSLLFCSLYLIAVVALSINLVVCKL